MRGKKIFNSTILFFQKNHHAPITVLFVYNPLSSTGEFMGKKVIKKSTKKFKKYVKM